MQALKSIDDRGGYPSDDGMKKCLKALGWLDPDYDDETPDKERA